MNEPKPVIVYIKTISENIQSFLDILFTIKMFVSFGVNNVL